MRFASPLRPLGVTADDSPATVVVVVDGLRADLALVDALARFGLAVRRIGGQVRVVGASVELRALLDLAGLSATVVTDGTVTGDAP